MKDPVSEGLNLLAAGLRPYVAERVICVFRNEELSAEIFSWDAQSLIIFMWERWNDLFRTELSFVERSLLSELRDFRNRWAHQDPFDEVDVYRVLDDIERLLKAVHSEAVVPVSDLRRESLDRLWLQELGDDERNRRLRQLWPYLLCGASSIAIGATVVHFGKPPWSWFLSSLVFLGLMRAAFFQARREARSGPGPHECSHCGRIVYTVDCPYCHAIIGARNGRDTEGHSAGLAAARLHCRSQTEILSHMRAGPQDKTQMDSITATDH